MKKTTIPKRDQVKQISIVDRNGHTIALITNGEIITAHGYSVRIEPVANERRQPMRDQEDELS